MNAASYVAYADAFSEELSTMLDFQVFLVYGSIIHDSEPTLRMI